MRLNQKESQTGGVKKTIVIFDIMIVALAQLKLNWASTPEPPKFPLS